MSSSVELTKRLRALDDEHLHDLLASRITQPGLHRDFFDVADELLTTASITTVLQECTASELVELANYPHVSEDLGQLVSWNLLDHADEKALLPEVVELLSSINITEIYSASAVQHVTGAPAQAALEHALMYMGALDELCRLLQETPAKSLASGALSAPELVRLGSVVPEPCSVSDFLVLGRLAGIVARVQRSWVITDSFTTWQQLSTEDKWEHCVRKVLASLPRALSAVLQETPQLPPAAHWLDQRFPLGTTWLKVPLGELLVCAEVLGLTTPAGLTTTGVNVLASNWEQVHKDLNLASAPTAEKVFIQHDFTVIAPGPLATPAENFIRALCSVESRGVAMTYRITEAGVDQLLASGSNGEEIIAQLRALSQTELPQAVEYFITDRAEKFGSLVVSATEEGSVVACRNEQLAAALTHDRGLRALGFTQLSDTKLGCRHPVHVVLRALREAKYSAQASENSSAISRSGDATIKPAQSPTQDLVARLRSLSHTEQADDATWIARQLDLAVREKATVTLTVSMPEGQKEFVVLATGFANGRLRCLDKKTDVERTLPASHITAVRKS